MKIETMLLSQKEIESMISMKDVVECVDKTFRGMGEGTVVNPTKVNLDLGEAASFPAYNGFMNAMPARPFAASAEPALNPNHPNHRSPAPSSTNGTLCAR